MVGEEMTHCFRNICDGLLHRMALMHNLVTDICCSAGQREDLLVDVDLS